MIIRSYLTIDRYSAYLLCFLVLKVIFLSCIMLYCVWCVCVCGVCVCVWCMCVWWWCIHVTIDYVAAAYLLPICNRYTRIGFIMFNLS